MWIRRDIVLFIVAIFLNIGIHRKCVSCYSHSYFFFLVTNYQIWVYKGMRIHFLLDT